jgi:hypothetical protein
MQWMFIYHKGVQIMGKHEEELARELQRRGMSRRDVLRIGLRMGLGAASMGLLLAACGQTASEPAKDAGGEAAAEPASESIFDITAGDTGVWPKSAIA